MSNRTARARAESGLILRGGHLVDRDEWYAAHPTPEMKRDTQARVDRAVREEMLRLSVRRHGVKLPRGGGLLIVKDGKILDPKDTDAVTAEIEYAVRDRTNS